MILINNQANYTPLDIITLQNWLTEVCRIEGKSLGELGLNIVSDDELLNINRDFLNHDYYTDIITFDSSYNNVVTGELWVSIDRVNDNAKSLQILPHDELMRVIVHGVLHLIGYGDASISEKTIMSAKENKYLQLIIVY